MPNRIESPTVSTAVMEVDDEQDAARVTMRTPGGEQYKLAMVSGLLTVIAAGTITAGHLAAFRWMHATKLCLIHRIYCKWRTITGFTAAQPEVAMRVVRLSGYSASHGGGTAAVLTSPTAKRRAAFTTLVMGTDLDARIGAAAALTAGTHTLDAQPLGWDGVSELAAAATVPKGRFDIDVNFDVDYGGPQQLLTNEGFIVQNDILMGAGGTGRLSVDIDFSVLTRGVANQNW